MSESAANCSSSVTGCGGAKVNLHGLVGLLPSYNAMGHCMSKALAIIWGVWRSGLDFDPTLGGPRT